MRYHLPFGKWANTLGSTDPWFGRWRVQIKVGFAESRKEGFKVPVDTDAGHLGCMLSSVEAGG